MHRPLPSPSKQAAARMLQATCPRHNILPTLRTYETFAAEVLAESGADVLATIVRQMRLNSALTRGAA